MFDSGQFDQTETVVWVWFGFSISVTQNRIAVHVYFAFGSTVWWSFAIKMLKKNTHCRIIVHTLINFVPIARCNNVCQQSSTKNIRVLLRDVS